MMKRISVVFVLLSAFLFTGCEEDTFSDIREVSAIPKDLVYAKTINAREHDRIESGPPTLDTGNEIPYFEIVSVKNKDGDEVSGDYLKDVHISNVSSSKDTIVDLDGRDYKSSIPNLRDIGNIIIDKGNEFGFGEYSFTIKVTTGQEEEEEEHSKIFEDVYQLRIGPQLVEDLLYSPLAQNLVVDVDTTSTTQPYILSGNEDVSFSLEGSGDKLKIDSETGVISLNDGYTTEVNDTIFPTVVVTSNISDETTEFHGKGFLTIIASKTPVDVPRRSKNIFYPTFEFENTKYGYKVDIEKLGLLNEGDVWRRVGGISPMADDERPNDIGRILALNTNAVVGGVSGDTEADVIINSQDLTNYRKGWDVSVVFYWLNKYVRYLEDGSTPSNLEVYVSTDYDGDNNEATWTKVNDQMESRIQGQEDTFDGMPYPGNQQGSDPEGRKNPAHNADSKWVRSELDLGDYIDSDNFTIKFKFASYFDGEIDFNKGEGRSGTYRISDVNFQAKEEKQ